MALTRPTNPLFKPRPTWEDVRAEAIRLGFLPPDTDTDTDPDTDHTEQAPRPQLRRSERGAQTARAPPPEDLGDDYLGRYQCRRRFRRRAVMECVYVENFWFIC